MSLLGVYNGNQSGEATGADKYEFFCFIFRLVNTYLCLLQLSPDSLPSILILLYAVPDINNTTTGYYRLLPTTVPVINHHKNETNLYPSRQICFISRQNNFDWIGWTIFIGWQLGWTILIGWRGN